MWDLNNSTWGRKKDLSIRESSSTSHTRSTKPMTKYKARSKVLWKNRDLSSPPLSVRSYGMTISQGITASERPSCKTLWGCQCKSWSDNIKEWTDMTMLELLKATANWSPWRRLPVSSALRLPHTLFAQECICNSYTPHGHIRYFNKPKLSKVVIFKYSFTEISKRIK